MAQMGLDSDAKVKSRLLLVIFGECLLPILSHSNSIAPNIDSGASNGYHSLMMFTGPLCIET